MGLGNENIALINQLGGDAGGCISMNEAILCAEVQRLQQLSDSRLENIKAMSGYLDDLAESLGVAKPNTPVEGVGACWKVMGAIQELLSAASKSESIEDFVCFLIDAHETDVITEEGLRQYLADYYELANGR